MSNILKNYKVSILLITISIFCYSLFAHDLDRSNFVKLISLIGILFVLTYKILQLNKGKFWLLAGIGIIFRLLFIGILPNLSQDFYRFIWDGRLVFQGINPYLFIPVSVINNLSAALGETNNITIFQAQELYNGMGNLNGSHFSNYPPINQVFFAIAALFTGKSILGSVIVMRIFIILADVGILYFGKKLLIKLDHNPNKIFWYFLNPFIIIELTGNLHFEGVMLFFFIWSLYLLSQKKWLWSAVLLGISISVKLIPLLFLPLFFQLFIANKKISTVLNLTKLFIYYLLIIGIAAITFLPFYSAEFLINFSETIGLWFQNFEFNASIYYIIRWIGFKIVGWNIIETVGKILPIIVVVFVLVLTFFRKNKSFQQLITALLFGISFYFLLSTTVHPWYVATPLLLAVFTNYKFPIVWSFAVILSYSAYGIDGFQENLWIVALEYLVVIAYFVWEMFLKKNNSSIKANNLQDIIILED